LDEVQSAQMYPASRRTISLADFGATLHADVYRAANLGPFLECVIC